MSSSVYKYYKNPMLFGVFLLYLSIVLWLNSLCGAIFIILFISLMSVYVKKFEKPRVLHDFGNEYEIYKDKTAFLIPFMKDKFWIRYF